MSSPLNYRQRAIFRPRGLAGHAYWRSISPFHGVVFGGMLKNITAAAEQAERAATRPSRSATERLATIPRRAPGLIDRASARLALALTRW